MIESQSTVYSSQWWHFYEKLGRSATEESSSILYSKLEDTTKRPVAFQFNILCCNLGFKITKQPRERN